MLPGVEANTTMNYEGGMARIACIFMQYQSGVVTGSSQYETYLMTSTDMDNYWGGLYVGAMKNAQLMYQMYESSRPYYAGIARINMAINMGIATSLWGDVPYSQAFGLGIQGGNITGTTQPKMDAQQSILNAIQAQLNQAITDLNQPYASNTTVPGGDDVMFQGNTTAWIKVAYTLKARYFNWTSKRSPGPSADSVVANLALGMASNADNLYTAHNSTADQNQWAAFENGRGYNVANETLIDSLNINGRVDPRTNWYFDTTGSGNGTPVGNILGQLNPNGNDNMLGPYLYNGAGTLPTPVVTYAEAEFLLAEAQERLGSSASALTALNAAIAASISNVTQGQGTTYTVPSASLHTIMTEKWKAMFGQPLEAYADYRRTTFPSLMVNPIGVLTYIPQRFPVDLQESTANPNAVFIPLNVPVWFAQ